MNSLPEHVHARQLLDAYRHTPDRYKHQRASDLYHLIWRLSPEDRATLELDEGELEAMERIKPRVTT